jgi:transposase
MQKTDARKLDPEIEQHLRHQVIQLRKAGKTYKEIGQVIGVHPTNACKMCKACEPNGAKAIQRRKRGLKIGACRTLPLEQKEQFWLTIADTALDQLTFGFALWTHRAAQELVSQLFEIKMPIRTVDEYLSRWRLSPQKPFRKAYTQYPVAIKNWLDEQHPAIAQRARQQQMD